MAPRRDPRTAASAISDTLPDGALAITDEAERRAGEFGLGISRPAASCCGGAQAVHALCPGTRIEWAEPGEVLRLIPGPADQAGDRVLLVLADGSAVAVLLLPEFIAELGFENGEGESGLRAL